MAVVAVAVAEAEEASVEAPAVVALAVAEEAEEAEAPSVGAKTEEAWAVQLRWASTPAVWQPVSRARLEPQPLGPGVALRAKQPVRAELQRLPMQERPFGQD